MTSPSDPPLPAGGHRFLARSLMRACRKAALATTLPNDDGGGGRPYVSLVTVATDLDGGPLLLLSRLADHTRNLDGDGRVSLLFDGTEGLANPQTGPRVTVVGRIAPGDAPRHRRRFLARHPGAALYADFADFAFRRVEVERVHWVGGFARALWLDDGVTLDRASAESFAEAEEDVLAHMNRDHADAVRLYAERLLGQPAGDWTLVAVDCDGCDLAAGEQVARLAFEAPASRPADLRGILAGLAARARTAAS